MVPKEQHIYDNYNNDELFQASASLISRIELHPSLLAQKDYENKTRALLAKLKQRCLYGPYSVISFIQKSLYVVTNRKSECHPLPIDFYPEDDEGIDGFYSPKNFVFIEHFIDMGRVEIIVWSYIYAFHDKFKKWIEEKVEKKSRAFNKSYKNYGEAKIFESQETLNITEFEGYCQIYFSIFGEIANLKNIDQVLNSCSFTETFELLMSKYTNFTNYFLRRKDEQTDIWIKERNEYNLNLILGKSMEKLKETKGKNITRLI